MNSLKTIALLGATGKAGQYILSALLTSGFNVRALVRQPENFSYRHSRMEIIKGDAADGQPVNHLPF